MFPFLRYARVLWAAPRRPRIGPLESSTVSFRVLPGDIDQNRHLNNGRYLTMMDLGRFDLLGRLGVLGELRSRRWFPVVTAATIRFRRPMDTFQAYEMRTRILGWDEQSVFVEQRIERAGNVHAVGVIRGTFLSPSGRVPMTQIAALVAPGIPSPTLPPWVSLWNQSQELLSEELRAAPNP